MSQDSGPLADAVGTDTCEKSLNLTGRPTDSLSTSGWTSALARTRLVVTHDEGMGEKGDVKELSL